MMYIWSTISIFSPTMKSFDGSPMTQTQFCMNISGR